MILLNQTTWALEHLGITFFNNVLATRLSVFIWPADYSKQLDQVCPHEVKTGATIIKSQLLLQATWNQAFRYQNLKIKSRWNTSIWGKQGQGVQHKRRKMRMLHFFTSFVPPAAHLEQYRCRTMQIFNTQAQERSRVPQIRRRWFAFH